MNTRQLADKAFQHIDMISSQIGGRPAGSQEEARAFDYIECHLTGLGYVAERQPVAFAPPMKFYPLYTLAGVLVVLCSWLIPIAAPLTLFLPLVLAALPDLNRVIARYRHKTAQTVNLLVKHQNEKKDQNCLILCAHVDSARANVFQSQRALRWFGLSHYLAQRMALLVAGVSVWALLGGEIPAGALTIVGCLGSLVGGWWIVAEYYSQLGKPPLYSPGAYDNASGVGVIMALAEHYAVEQPKDVAMRFLFTGAEETGMHGARAFADQLNGDRVSMINYDMVGAGQALRYVTTDGVFYRRYTSQLLNALIKRVNPQAMPLWYSRRSGDYLPFIEKGIPVTSLQTSGSRDAEFYYHTLNDKICHIDTSTLDMVIATTIDLISTFQMDKNCCNELPV